MKSLFSFNELKLHILSKVGIMTSLVVGCHARALWPNVSGI